MSHSFRTRPLRSLTSAGRRAVARLAAGLVLALAFLPGGALQAGTTPGLQPESSPQSLAEGLQPGLVGKPAPDFTLRALHHDNQRLSEHLGEVVLINFWGSWCGRCRQQMPQLEQLYQKYRLAGLTLLSINLDESAARAAEMAQALKISYPVLMDERKEVSRAYRVSTLPVTVLVDRAGVVRLVDDGYQPGQEQRHAGQLRKLLNE